MNSRRQSTVHDLAALRLHRDGTRVLNSDTNLSSRHAKFATRDARGNWIAQDSAGLGTVKKRCSASQPDGGEEDLTDPNEELLEDPQVVTTDKGKGRARDSDDEDFPVAMNRAEKRRRFDEDMSYLESRGSSPSRMEMNHPKCYQSHLRQVIESSAMFKASLSQQDLLKCLHYFASTYYTAMGQLSDVTREVRKERKIRRARKQGKASGPSSSPEVIDIDDISEDSQDPFDTEDGTTQVPQNDVGRPEARKKRRPRERRPMEKDMYKLFDGSALIALGNSQPFNDQTQSSGHAQFIYAGMILQHHILEQLEPCVPEGWEKGMVVAERVQQADTKKEKQARRMRHQRHVVKSESEPVEVESEDEKVVEGQNEAEKRHQDFADTHEDGDIDEEEEEEEDGDEDEDEEEDEEEEDEEVYGNVRQAKQIAPRIKVSCFTS
ncbi:hypothetical protein C8Q80DRAFT_1343025 [Daedaleopsis nitida]|nr:hypothetical protein C8Q80DRAFT_1343025 [Daedaleopsis nitida]